MISQLPKFDSLIVNANALLDLTKLEPIQNTCIGIVDGKICLIRQTSDWSSYRFDKLIDLKGKLLTPGLIDCHTHLIFAGNRANEFKKRLNGVSYKEIADAGGGIKATVAATNLASAAELLDLAISRAEIMQSYGTTTIEVKSGYGLSCTSEIKILEVAKLLDSKVASEIIPTFLGAHAVPQEYAKSSDGYIDLIINEMLPQIKQLNLANSVDAFCENIGFSCKQVERLFTAATKFGFAVKLHAEQLSDQKGAVMACKFNALSVDHIEYLDPLDVVYLIASKTVAVLLPGAFYFLKETKQPPIQALRQNKVPIALATDFNPGTSPFLSLPLIMNMGCVSFGLTIAEAWQGVTINAAKALGLGTRLGSIEMGKQADFAVWQCESPEQIVYSPTEHKCESIIKKGKLV